MPQMSPMNWLILFMFFNIIFFFTISKFFYFAKIKVNQKTMELSNSKSLKFFI